VTKQQFLKTGFPFWVDSHYTSGPCCLRLSINCYQKQPPAAVETTSLITSLTGELARQHVQNPGLHEPSNNRSEPSNDATSQGKSPAKNHAKALENREEAAGGDVTDGRLPYRRKRA
jgi:hypothetical protein